VFNLARLVNVTEILLFEILDSILKDIPEFCGCDRCRMDVAAIALNNLPTSYVVTGEGEVKKRIAVLEVQMRTDITQAIVRAAEIVMKQPHHHRDN
jgi:competence protein ComFB